MIVLADSIIKMDSDETRHIFEKYVTLKAAIRETTVVLHEVEADIKKKYHIGYPITGHIRSSFAQFRSCTQREMNIKRAVKTYYIGDGKLTESGLYFKSHPLMNFDFIVNEIKALCELNHPNIIRLFDVYCTKKYIHLVTEMCKGEELYDHLTHDRLNVDEAVSIIIQILEGVKYMHSKKYCHRGLCIENVMFADNDKKKIKIISLSGAININEPHKLKYGSPMYMAPEVFTEDYNEKCDIWSIGVIFFTLINKHQPFQAASLDELKSRIEAIDYIKSETWGKLPKMAKKFIKKIFVNYKKRPSAEKLLDDVLINSHMSSSNKLALKKLMRTVKSIKPDSNFSIKVRLSNKLKISVYRMLRSLNLMSDLAGLEHLWNELGSGTHEVLMEHDIVNNIERVMTKGDMSHRAHQVLKKFDLDKRGFVTKDEFIGLLCDMSDKTLLMQAFSMLDYDVNGKISSDDFDTYFDDVGYENLYNLMEDALGTNEIDYEQFSLLITKFVVT